MSLHCKTLENAPHLFIDRIRKYTNTSIPIELSRFDRVKLKNIEFFFTNVVKDLRKYRKVLLRSKLEQSYFFDDFLKVVFYYEYWYAPHLKNSTLPLFDATRIYFKCHHYPVVLTKLLKAMKDVATQVNLITLEEALDLTLACLDIEGDDAYRGKLGVSIVTEWNTELLDVIKNWGKPTISFFDKPGYDRSISVLERYVPELFTSIIDQPNTPSLIEILETNDDDLPKNSKLIIEQAIRESGRATLMKFLKNFSIDKGSQIEVYFDSLLKCREDDTNRIYIHEWPLIYLMFIMNDYQHPYDVECPKRYYDQIRMLLFIVPDAKYVGDTFQSVLKTSEISSLTRKEELKMIHTNRILRCKYLFDQLLGTPVINILNMSSSDLCKWVMQDIETIKLLASTPYQHFVLGIVTAFQELNEKLERSRKFNTGKSISDSGRAGTSNYIIIPIN